MILYSVQNIATRTTQAMGNTYAQYLDFVAYSPLRLMNEDTFLLVLKYLDVRDYVQLTMLCRDFVQTFSSNNFLWGQVCEIFAQRLSLVQSGAALPSLLNSVSETGIQSSVSRVLLAANKGERLQFDDHSLTPNDEVNVRDKRMVSQFNFHEAIKRYYIHYIHRQALQDHCQLFIEGTVHSVKIRVRNYTGQFGEVVCQKDLKHHKCARDYYYEVDFGCNAKKLATMQKDRISYYSPQLVKQPISGPPISTKPSTDLYHEVGGRLVVYQQSNKEPQWRLPKARTAYKGRRHPGGSRGVVPQKSAWFNLPVLTVSAVVLLVSLASMLLR